MNPRVLVTNDDGIDSPGLIALARCAIDLGWETVVAAPASESSGTSAGLTAAKDDREVVVERRTLPELPDVEAYAVLAHPGLISLIACHDGFGGRPDLVLSGVNRGANVGRAILHSGTVGAALTAGVNGARGVAVSLDTELELTTDPHWSSAAAVLAGFLPVVADWPEGSVVNVNVPDRPAHRIGAIRWARLATYGRVQSKVTQLDDDLIEVGSLVVDGELEADTDAAVLADGNATATAILSVSEDESLMTTPPAATLR